MSDLPDYETNVVVVGTVTITGTVIISGTVTVTGTVEVKGTVSISGTVDVKGTVAVSGTVTVTGSVTVSNTVTVTGAVSVTGTVSISGTVTILGAVTITSGSITITNTSIQVENKTGTTIAVSGTVAISGTVTIQGTVSISGTVTVAGSVTVSGTVAISGTVTVTGTVAISGTVTITGSVSITGTVTISGAVTITSGAVTIATSGGTNIVIDKLTQASYLERRATLENDNGVTTPDAPPAESSNTYRGKFFPRGCRGYIYALYIYCRRTAAGTLTLAASPYIGGGEVFTVTITPAAGWDWKVGYPLRFWHYDSMFIWVKSCSADVFWACDVGAGTPDWHESADSGVTWTHDSNRVYIKISLKAETVGDLPVSGTVNTVEIPSISSGIIAVSGSLPTGVETTISTTYGIGHISWLLIVVSHPNVLMRVYCDDVLAFSLSPSTLNTYGYGTTTPIVSHLVYSADSNNVVQIAIRFEFRRKLSIKFTHSTGDSELATVYGSPVLIS